MSGELLNLEDLIQVSSDGKTVWIHSPTDGSTVGRFSKKFGMDVHTTVADQLQGAGQCLCCTHEPPAFIEWDCFVRLIHEHHGIVVPTDLIQFQ